MITIWVYLCINTFLLNLTAISRGLDCGEMKTTHCLGRILPQLSFEAPKMTMSDSDCCVYFKPKGNVKYFPGVCEFGVCEFGVCVWCICVWNMLISRGLRWFLHSGGCMYVSTRNFSAMRDDMSSVSAPDTGVLLHWAKVNAASPGLFFLGPDKNIRISISMWQPNTPISQRWIDNAAGTDE